MTALGCYACLPSASVQASGEDGRSWEESHLIGSLTVFEIFGVIITAKCDT